MGIPYSNLKKSLSICQQRELKREVQELFFLFDISQRLSKSHDLYEIADFVLKSMKEHLGMIRGMITILNRETGEIFINTACGLSPEQQARGRYKLGEGVVGKVVETGEPAIIPKISEEPLFLDRTKVRTKLNKKDISFICVPIKHGSEIIGTLSSDRLFSHTVAFDEDLRLLTIIASLIGQAVASHQAVEEKLQRFQLENERLKEELIDRFRPSNIIGNSKAIRGVYDLINQVSKSNATVIVRGESGTGKELIAQAIHYNSPRAKKPLIKVNCAALPEAIIESELFGHEKGAFTGAVSQKKGRFERAEGGTIFLDEIGELSASMQVKLLRVLQEKEFERVGGVSVIKADVRIITATNRDLEDLVRKGEFREDLYYRLNVFPVHSPPLRERKTDIMLLTDYFTEKYSSANGKKIRRITTDAIDMIASYHWPGNIRELENCIERAVILSNDGVIHGYHLPPSLQKKKDSGVARTASLQDTLEMVEKDLIVDALKSARGNVAEAGRTLDLSERMMGIRVRKYNIDPKRFKAKNVDPTSR